MKTLILSISAALLSNLAIAQCEIHHVGETADISGTTLQLAAIPGTDNFIEVEIENTSGMEKLWKIRRVRLSTPPAEWQDWVCWGVEGDQFGGICYPNSPSNPWTTPAPAQHMIDGEPAGGIAANESGVGSFHVNPGDNNGGTAHFRYYIFQDGGEYEDSIDVIATGTLSVKDQEKDIVISVYPNPVSNTMTVSAPGMTDEFTVKMTDVLGKVVYTDEGVSPKKIDVSEFRNGVYIVAIMQKGVAVQTKRVVVKH